MSKQYTVCVKGIENVPSVVIIGARSPKEAVRLLCNIHKIKYTNIEKLKHTDKLNANFVVTYMDEMCKLKVGGAYKLIL